MCLAVRSPECKYWHDKASGMRCMPVAITHDTCAWLQHLVRGIYIIVCRHKCLLFFHDSCMLPAALVTLSVIDLAFFKFLSIDSTRLLNASDDEFHYSICITMST